MDFRRKVKGVPLVLIVAVALLTVGAIAQVGYDYYEFIYTTPTIEVVDQTVVIVDTVDFLWYNLTIVGTGQVSDLHTVYITFRNVKEGYTLESANYNINANNEGGSSVIDVIVDGGSPVSLPTLNYGEEYTGEHDWTPSTILAYTMRLGVNDMVWSIT